MPCGDGLGINGKEMEKENRIKWCGECADFLYEDTSGYGICTKDNDLHSCGERCIYSVKSEKE